MHMDTTCWHMNATLGGANLHPGVNLHPRANLHPGANCAYEHGFRDQFDCLLMLLSIIFTHKLNAHAHM